jgi:predicted transcriptional regulator
MVPLYFREEYITDMAMDFQRLQSRLITNLRERVRSGEITERNLARVTGVSQPHLHNVLKGKRLLSFGKADQILRQLHLDLADLMNRD